MHCCHFLVLRTLFVAAVPLLAVVSTVVAAPESIPLDPQGLPEWEIRVYDDFPVRIDLEDRAALTLLLSAVPIADFDREQVRPGPGERVILETRVTDTEATALMAAGYSVKRLPDFEQQGRREMELEWARHAAPDVVRIAPQAGKTTIQLTNKYHTVAQIGQILQMEATNYPTLARTLSIGSSVQGRPLYTLEISKNVGVSQAEPEVRLASTIHGNEPVGQEMLIYLADYLLTQYGKDAVVTDLVDHTDLFITPCLNPDGLTSGSRYNAHAVDLNRNYPVPDGTIGADNLWTQEPETDAVIAFGAAHHFVVSENGHSGTLVVNYPWDYQYPVTPDDAAIIRLSLEYSTYNLPMYNGPFPQGITNGAAWYVVKGGLQDWSYAQTGCIDVTIELADKYAPPASQLDTFWNNNRQSLLHYVKAARYGIHGIVRNSFSGEPLAATVSVVGNAKSVTTDPAVGDYYKLLPTGTYTVVVSAAGYISQTISGVSTVWGTPTELNVSLDPLSAGAGAIGAARPGEPVGDLDHPYRSLVCTPNPLVTGTTLHFSLAQPDRVNLSIYDATGRRVRSLVDEARPAGSFAVSWDGRSSTGQPVPNGVYFARLERNGHGEVAKLAIAR